MLSSRLPWQLDLFSSQTKTFVSEITGRIRAWKQADSCSEYLPLAIQIGQCLLLVGFNGNPGRKRVMGMGRCTICYPRASVDHSLRHHNFFQLPKADSTLFQSSPLYFASHIFNILPKHIQSSTRLSEFKKKAQQYFLSPSCPCSMHALTSM